MSGAVLVQFSSLDLSKFLPLGRQAFNRNLAEPADGAGFEPPLHHMLCVAAMKDENLRPSAKAVVPYLNLFHAGFLIAADERDFGDILELTGMPAVLVDSCTRGIRLAFVAGNLSQWKDAVLRGSQRGASRESREVFNKVHAEFNRIGMADIFEARKVPAQDATYYLEYHK